MQLEGGIFEKFILIVIPRSSAAVGCAGATFDFFNLNALSSLFMIRIYFDVVLTIVADALYRLLADDLKRFEDCTPKTIFSDFINCKCNGEVVGDEIIIKMKKKATTPIFRSNDVYQKSYPIPWLGNKRLRFDWIS